MIYDIFGWVQRNRKFNGSKIPIKTERLRALNPAVKGLISYIFGFCSSLIVYAFSQRRATIVRSAMNIWISIELSRVVVILLLLILLFVPHI